MNSMFYTQFQIENNKCIFFCGDESRELLSSILSKEMVNLGQKAVFLSNIPLKYPVEGQILVDIDPELLRQKLKTEESQIFYLCSTIENEMLLPLEAEKWPQILKINNLNIRFLFLISKEAKFELEILISEKNACMISSLNFSNLEGQLETFFSNFNTDEQFQEELRKHWQKTVEGLCPGEFLNQNVTALKRYLFINQAKSLIDENKIMGILRNLTNFYDKIFMGDINDFKIKEI